ncbi:MAG: UrcA family protein [Brevundimonas aurantiaca]|uniref:UrcA family protein n=1 Tax=Brevundimonas aurantiaca TaxID=74316 RepID=UPI00391C943A
MKVLSPVLFAVAVLSASSALAQDVRIPFGDLDLASTAGAAAFDARVDQAAERLCRDLVFTSSRITNRGVCRAAVRAEALRQLPRLHRVQYVRVSRDARPVLRAATASDEG